jgi:hypothetical protein
METIMSEFVPTKAQLIECLTRFDVKLDGEGVNGLRIEFKTNEHKDLPPTEYMADMGKFVIKRLLEGCKPEPTPPDFTRN